MDKTTDSVPEWLDMMIQCSKISATKICLVSVKTFLKILKPNNHQMQDQVGGNSYMHI